MADVDSPPKKKSRPSMDLEEEVEGFKFTRQSKRSRLAAKKSATTKSLQKRRSSFVRGRKERKSLAPLVTGDIPNLYVNIPTELPPTARLRKLFDASVELAITKLNEKSSNVKSDLPDFEEEAKAVLNQLRQLISDSDIIDEASQPSEQKNMIPNPKNKNIEKKAVASKLNTNRLQIEAGKWDDLLQENNKLEEKTKQELQECLESSESKEECPDFLSTSQHKLLSGKPAFKSLAEERENLRQTSLLMVDKISQVATGLQKYKRVTEDYINKQMQSFGAKSLNVINDMGTPRTLIRGHLTGQ